MSTTRNVIRFTDGYPSGRCLLLCKAFHDPGGMQPKEAIQSAQRLSTINTPEATQ